MGVQTSIRRTVEERMPVEPVNYDTSRMYRIAERNTLENPMFRLKWNIFVGVMITLIVLMLLGIAYVATQYSIKQYRLQQLEESLRNLEVQISHAQAENLGARRDVFFDAGLKNRLNLEYPQVTKFVHLNPVVIEPGVDSLVRSLYGLSASTVEFGGAFPGF